MSEHVHELWWNEDDTYTGDWPFVCECGYRIDAVTALDYINAAEQLSAEDAVGEASYIEYYGGDGSKLRAYAEARGE